MAEKKKESLGFIGNLSRIIEIPKETIVGGTRLEVLGNTEVVLEGCQSVLEYCDNCIRVSTGAGSIKFLGQNLAIKTMSEGLISIEGRITSIEF